MPRFYGPHRFRITDHLHGDAYAADCRLPSVDVNALRIIIIIVRNIGQSEEKSVDTLADDHFRSMHRHHSILATGYSATPMSASNIRIR